MKQPRIYPVTIAVMFVMLVALVATRRDFTRRNGDFFTWGMVDSPAYATQSANPVFADGKTMRAPVGGTLARGDAPFPYGPSRDDRDRAGFAVENPFEPTPEVLARGREVYEDFCFHCHGPEGRGYGPVARRAKLGMSIVETATRQRPDAALFHIITYGRLLMPSHAGQISPDDRWKVVHYLRRLQEEAEAAKK